MAHARVSTPLVAPLLFASGACALIYQVAWLRELRLVFGASTAATAAVLAIFMGGLGIGSALLGRRADRLDNPLALYARLELGVALCAAVTPALLLATRWTYTQLGGAPALGTTAATLLRLLLASLVLGMPTFLMGGTLPAAARAVERSADSGRRHLAVLYGTNTLGAVTGAALATFVMLELFGTRATLWLACAVNLLIALAARVVARRSSMPPQPTISPSSQPAPEVGPDRATVRLTVFAAAVVGFVFLLMELVWYRMLGPILGGSTFTFGLILSVALAGIGLGGAVYAAAAWRRPTLMGFALSCALEGLFMALPFAAGDHIAILAVLLSPMGSIGFVGRVLGWLLVTSLVVLPAAIVSGYQFPLLVGLLGSGDHAVGEHTGITYAANTGGAIVGSLCGGFLLLPSLGAIGCWRLAASLLALLGVAATWLAIRRSAHLASGSPALCAAAATLLLLVAQGPTALWRHSPIGAGRISFEQMDKNGVRDWSQGHRRSILWEAEGRETSVALTNADGLAFVINGKTDGNARYDGGTQVGLGLVAAALHPAPRNGLVIGLGTGSSAGWMAAVEGIQQVDVVELEPAIVEVANRSTLVNHDAMDNPKIRLIIGDGRELLLTTPKRYDLIVSEPSNPYRAGIASLFTREFYQAVAERLNDGGIFGQWLQGYEVDTQTVRTVLTTLSSVFPEVETWQTMHNDILFVCSRSKQTIDTALLARRLTEEPFASGFLHVWGSRHLEGFLAHFVARTELAERIASRDAPLGWVNTDDRMLVEFGLARTVGVRHIFDVGDLGKASRHLGLHRPAMTDDDVDWSLVEDYRMMISTIGGQTIPATLVDDDAHAARATALNQFLAGDMAAVLEAWSQQDRGPVTPIELAMLAEALAVNTQPEALELCDHLAPSWPATAAAIRGQYHWHSGDPNAAVASFTDAFHLLRDHPWAMTPVMRRALVQLPPIAARHRELAPRLEELVSQPFAVYVLEHRRRLVHIDIARLISPQRCVLALAPLEEYPPWTRAFLSTRLSCYQEAIDPRAERARRDLDEFFAGAPLSFSESVR